MPHFVYRTGALILLAGSFAFVTEERYAGSPSETGTASRSTASLHVQQARPKEGVEAEIVTIRPSGFEPSEIKRPKGPFVLVIADRSGLDEVTPRLQRTTGNPIREVNVSRRRPNWREVFDLQPGRYILTEANHPNWTCEITIAAEK